MKSALFGSMSREVGRRWRARGEREKSDSMWYPGSKAIKASTASRKRRAVANAGVEQQASGSNHNNPACETERWVVPQPRAAPPLLLPVVPAPALPPPGNTSAAARFHLVAVVPAVLAPPGIYLHYCPTGRHS
jgi:hypothetical protein